MRRSNSPTLQDVGREAGVTAMTVSVVLNGARSATRVSDATRTRILEAAARLRYRPNAAARGLQRRRMDTVGVASVIDGGELNLYFLEVLNGVLETAAKRGQNTTVFSISDWHTDEARILEWCDGRVDGMIFIGAEISLTFAETLHQRTSFVTIHSDTVSPHFLNLDVENEEGAYRVVRHLLDLGHRDILHLSGGNQRLGSQQRMVGYRRALAEASIPEHLIRIVDCGFSINAGRTKMAQFLQENQHRPLPTAIFCASDGIAVGCLETLTAHGIRVPEHLSVVGFDDTLNAQMTNPPLTTMRQPFRHLGQLAVERLLTRIQEEEQAPTDSLPETPAVSPQTEILPVELVIRTSSAPPPTQPVFPRVA